MVYGPLVTVSFKIQCKKNCLASSLEVRIVFEPTIEPS